MVVLWLFKVTLKNCSDLKLVLFRHKSPQFRHKLLIAYRRSCWFVVIKTYNNHENIVFIHFSSSGLCPSFVGSERLSRDSWPWRVRLEYSSLSGSAVYLAVTLSLKTHLIDKGSIKITFVTAHADYVVEGFELQALDYLLKPVEFGRFLQGCNRALGQQAI